AFSVVKQVTDTRSAPPVCRCNLSDTRGQHHAVRQKAQIAPLVELRYAHLLRGKSARHTCLRFCSFLLDASSILASAAHILSSAPVGFSRLTTIRQMTTFYDEKDLEEDLRPANCPDEDLQFDYLFEYEPPCSDYADQGYENQEARNYLDNIRPPGLALSPRIEITPSREHYSHGRDSLPSQHLNISPRPTLTVPGYENLAYREPQCLSPASSNSSTSWHSESYSPWASPCVSPSSGPNPGDLCPRMQSIHTCSPRTSPGTSPHTSVGEDSGLVARSPSPRPRSTSPQGKRTYEMYQNPGLMPGQRSRSPSPHSVQQDLNVGAHFTHASLVENGFGSSQTGLVPTKIVKTSNQVYALYPENHGDGNYLVSSDQDIKSKPTAEPFFVIPSIWPKPLPHAFYQVHRITGKTVTTNSYEKIINGTKVLEIPLEPKNNMKAIIDCAGILKLRNADIELRKGETDVGRKNTRVRLSMLFVEVPSYRDTSVCQPVKVNFYVINGKRKRSQPQHFTFTPLTCKAPAIKTEPLDEYEAQKMGFGIPQILGLSPHSYYHNPRSILHPDNGLVSSMAPCQRFSSSLPSQDTRFQQQSPAIVYSRGGKNISSSPGTWHTGGVMPDPHRSVLVHTGSTAQSVGPISTSQQPSIIQFSPTNHHLLRAGDAEALPPPQPDNQQILFCDGYTPQAASHSSGHPQAQAAVTHQQPCPTVIQQQPFGQKEPQKVSHGTPGMEAAGDAQRRVTIKEENLDQAYLDDGECKLLVLCSF
ncbi:hypothetical protein XENOCAPTIV_002983, partial [Xenoophorus captivus]